MDSVVSRSEVEQVASERHEGVLMPLLRETLMKAIENGLDPDLVVKMAPDVALQVMPSITGIITKDLHRTKADLLRDLSADRAALADEMERLWGPAFATYEAVTYAVYELGDELHELRHTGNPSIIDDDLDTAEEDEEATSVDIMSLLHGRACAVALEILCLLRAGFADGAAARQRTLHELAVVIKLLTEYEHLDLPGRYIDYAVVEQREDVHQYQAHAGTLGYDPLAQAEVDEIEKQYQEVLTRRGTPFRRPYQWAGPLFPGDRDITFTKLETKAGLAHWRPYYRHANHSIHAGPRAAALNLHLGRDGWGVGTGARTDYNIAGVGHAALVSLMQCTSYLVTSLDENKWNLDRLLHIKVLQQLIDDAEVAFDRGARRL